MATDAKPSNLTKLKSSIADKSSSSKPKTDSSASKKKAVEGSSKSSAADAKHRSTANDSKATKKTSNQSKAGMKTATKTREKKVYSLPGQKYDVPEEREPLRIFYESLSKQIPSSEMAEFWLMEHGLLSLDRAKKANEKKQRKQKELRMGTPVKSPPSLASSKPASSKAETSQKLQSVPKSGDVKAKKQMLLNDTDDDDDDDFVLSHKRRKA